MMIPLRTTTFRPLDFRTLFLVFSIALLWLLSTPLVHAQTAQRLDTTNPEADGNFGWSVGTDGTDVVVGARREDIGSRSNAGRVYIYTPSASTWMLDLEAGAPGTEFNSFLGQAVVHTGGAVFAGAPFDDITGSADGGSIFQYEDDGTGYAFSTAYPEPDARDGGWFGNGMATDGIRLAVGAQRGDQSDEAGAVTIFDLGVDTNGSTTITRTGGTIRPSDLQADQRFGLSVSVLGEQGGEVVLGGAPLRDHSSGSNRGSLYGFRRNTSGSGTWQEFFRLSPSTATGSYFGYAVAQAGDPLNIPGRTIFVSALFQPVVPSGGNVAVSDAGTVYVYEIAGNGVSLNLEQTIEPPTPTTGGRFGQALVYDPSTETLYVGASGENAGSVAGAGAVYGYQKDTGGTWQEVFRLTADSPQAAASFGQSLSVADDLLIVGEPNRDVPNPSNPGTTISNAGASYIYNMASAIPVELAGFDARLDGTTARLTWQTVSETNNVGFYVEHRAPNASAFADAGFVKGAGTTTEAQTYAFSIDGLAPGMHAFRLRQVDVDGTATLSTPRTLRRQIVGMQLASINPHPVQKRSSLTLHTSKRADVTMHVYDVMGRRVATLMDGPVAAGSHTVTLDASALATGTYFVRVISGGTTLTEPVTVIR